MTHEHQLLGDYSKRHASGRVDGRDGQFHERSKKRRWTEGLGSGIPRGGIWPGVG